MSHFALSSAAWAFFGSPRTAATKRTGVFCHRWVPPLPMVSRAEHHDRGAQTWVGTCENQTGIGQQTSTTRIGGTAVTAQAIVKYFWLWLDMAQRNNQGAGAIVAHHTEQTYVRQDRPSRPGHVESDSTHTKKLFQISHRGACTAVEHTLPTRHDRTNTPPVYSRQGTSPKI